MNRFQSRDLLFHDDPRKAQHRSVEAEEEITDTEVEDHAVGPALVEFAADEHDPTQHVTQHAPDATYAPSHHPHRL